MSVTSDAGSIPDCAARRVARIAGSQHGVISRAQALSCGVGGRTIDRRLSSGVWDRLYPGVYRLAGAPATWRQSLLAACLAWGEGAVVSHRAAAALWGFPGFEPRGVELSVPRGRQRGHGHTVHRPVSLTRVDVTTSDAIPLTTAARTLIDVAACAPLDLVEEALDDALRRRLVTVGLLQRRLQELRDPGRRGCGAMARLISARANTANVPQSVLETRLLRALRRAGLPMPAIQHRIRTHRGPAVIDFAYVESRVAIEADGFRWHSSRQQWDRDQARNNALTMLGWTVVHVTWPQLRDRPAEVIDAIRVTLSRTRHPRAD